MPNFVVCVESGAVSASVAPCVDQGGAYTVPAVVAFPAPGEVHFANADELFAYGFAIVLTFWALGVTVGAILSLIRKGQ